MRSNQTLTALCGFAAGIVAGLVVAAWLGMATPREVSLERELHAATTEIEDANQNVDGRDRRIEELTQRLADADVRAEERLARTLNAIDAAGERMNVPAVTSLKAFLAYLSGPAVDADVIRLPRDDDVDERDRQRFRVKIGLRRCNMNVDALGDRVVQIEFHAAADVVPEIDDAAKLAEIVLRPWSSQLPSDWPQASVMKMNPNPSDMHEGRWYLGTQVIVQIRRVAGDLTITIRPSAQGMIEQVTPL